MFNGCNNGDDYALRLASAYDLEDSRFTHGDYLLLNR